MSRVWMPEEWFDSWFCTFTDLDRNGRYEVIVASMQGTGLYTYAFFYELDESFTRLLPCSFPLAEGDSAADLIVQEVPYYYDAAADTWWYAFDDIVRIAPNERLLCKDVLSLKDRTVTQLSLGSADELADLDGTVIRTCFDQNGNEISPEAFETLLSTRFGGAESGTLQLVWTQLEPPVNG